MPIVTSAKRRSQFSRRRDIGVAIQYVRDLVRIFLVHARECQFSESFGRLRIESATGRIRRGELWRRIIFRRDTD
jgi:hypothetical protein